MADIELDKFIKKVSKNKALKTRLLSDGRVARIRQSYIDEWIRENGHPNDHPAIKAQFDQFLKTVDNYAIYYFASAFPVEYQHILNEVSVIDRVLDEMAKKEKGKKEEGEDAAPEETETEEELPEEPEQPEEETETEEELPEEPEQPEEETSESPSGTPIIPIAAKRSSISELKTQAEATKVETKQPPTPEILISPKSATIDELKRKAEETKIVTPTPPPNTILIGSKHATIDELKRKAEETRTNTTTSGLVYPSGVEQLPPIQPQTEPVVEGSKEESIDQQAPPPPSVPPVVYPKQTASLNQTLKAIDASTSKVTGKTATKFASLAKKASFLVNQTIDKVSTAVGTAIGGPIGTAIGKAVGVVLKKTVGKIIDKGAQFVQEHKDELAITGLVVVGIMSGSPLIMLASFIFALLYFAALFLIPIAAFVTSMIIFLSSVFLLIAAIWYIINSNAYLVPPGGFGSQVGYRTFPGGAVDPCNLATSGPDITNALANRITNGVVNLLPSTNGAIQYNQCIDPTIIIMHWSGGTNDNPEGNDRTYETLVARDLACQLATDTDDTWLMQPFFENQVQMAWCAGYGNPFSVNNEMAGVYFTDNPPPPNLQELELAYDATCEVMEQYEIPWCQIFGHFEIPYNGGKTDPGRDFLYNVFIPEIRNRCPNDAGNVCDGVTRP